MLFNRFESIERRRGQQKRRWCLPCNMKSNGWANNAVNATIDLVVSIHWRGVSQDRKHEKYTTHKWNMLEYVKRPKSMKRIIFSTPHLSLVPSLNPYWNFGCFLFSSSKCSTCGVPLYFSYHHRKFHAFCSALRCQATNGYLLVFPWKVNSKLKKNCILRVLCTRAETYQRSDVDIMHETKNKHNGPAVQSNWICYN